MSRGLIYLNYTDYMALGALIDLFIHCGSPSKTALAQLSLLWSYLLIILVSSWAKPRPGRAKSKDLVALKATFNFLLLFQKSNQKFWPVVLAIHIKKFPSYSRPYRHNRAPQQEFLVFSTLELQWPAFNLYNSK